jgi:hypothetical protein
MLRLRILRSFVLFLSLLCCAPLGYSSTPAKAFGAVITADRAHIGEAEANVGTTLYGGDRVSTDAQGSMQVRAGAARLLLLGASAAIVEDNGGAPSARLVSGTATFSTGNAHAFTLYASKAAVRSQTDAPTIGTVTYVNDKELLVTARRGSLIVSVEDEEQVILEGTSYRVLLDPPAEEAQGPEGAGGGRGPSQHGGPLRAGRSRFLIVTAVLIGAGTGVAIWEACKSEYKP